MSYYVAYQTGETAHNYKQNRKRTAEGESRSLNGLLPSSNKEQHFPLSFTSSMTSLNWWFQTLTLPAFDSWIIVDYGIKDSEDRNRFEWIWMDLNGFEWIWMAIRRRRLCNHRKCQLQILGGSLHFPAWSVLPSCRIYLFDSGGLKRAGENARQLTWRNKRARKIRQQRGKRRQNALETKLLCKVASKKKNLPPTGRADLDVGKQDEQQRCRAPRGRLHLMALHVDILRKSTTAVTTESGNSKGQCSRRRMHYTSVLSGRRCFHIWGKTKAYTYYTFCQAQCKTTIKSSLFSCSLSTFNTPTFSSITHVTSFSLYRPCTLIHFIAFATVS